MGRRTMVASAEPKLTEKRRDEDGFGRTEAYRETKDEDGSGRTKACGEEEKKRKKNFNRRKKIACITRYQRRKTKGLD